jgi:hypothetical protein
VRAGSVRTSPARQGCGRRRGKTSRSALENEPAGPGDAACRRPRRTVCGKCTRRSAG